MRRSHVFVAAAAAAFAAGCGGGGSSSPAVVPAAVPGAAVPAATASAAPGATGAGISTDPRATARLTVTASGSIATLPHTASSARLPRDARTLRSSYAKIEIDGTLYQGAASGIVVTNSQFVTPNADGTFAVSASFGNVVPASNDWVVLNVSGVANDGSKVPFGLLAGFVNVGAGATSSAISAASTQVYQVAIALLESGDLSTYDVEQNAQLASTLATQIASANVAPNVTTGLFDATGLATIVNAIRPNYNRNLTVTVPGGANASFSVAYDWTQNDENDLAANVYASTALAQLGGVTAPTAVLAGAPVLIGAVSIGTLPPHAATSGFGHAAPVNVRATVISPNPAAATYTFRHVYGGHLIVGAHAVPGGPPVPGATATPAPAGIATFAPAAPGVNGNVSIALSDPTQAVSISDPAAAAPPAGFGVASNNRSYGIEVSPSAGSSGIVPTFSCSGSCYGDLRYGSGTGANYGIALNAAGSGFDASNPFNVPASQIRLCSITTCSAVMGGTVAVNSYLYDPGTNVAVYGWTESLPGASPAPLVAASPGPGYVATYPIPASATGSNAAPIVVTLNATAGTTIPMLVFPSRALSVATTLSVGSVPVVVTATDRNGATFTYTCSGVSSFNCSASSSDLTSVPGVDALQSLQLQFTIPAGAVAASTTATTTGQFALKSIASSGYSY